MIWLANSSQGCCLRVYIYDTGTGHSHPGMCRNCRGNDRQLQATIVYLKNVFLSIYIAIYLTVPGQYQVIHP